MATAEDSVLCLDGFEVLPETPGSVRGVHLEDFMEASPLQEHYCRAMLSEEEYETQTCSETEKALKDLIYHLESDPSIYMNLLRKRKMEEKEERSMASYFKSKLMQKLRGQHYMDNMVSQEECAEKLCEIKTGMLMAFNYTKETKSRRFSRRLQEKNIKQQAQDSEATSTPSSMGPPPPPPPPPPPKGPPPALYTPLKDIKNIKPMTPDGDLLRPSIHSVHKSLERTDSVRSIHDELKSSNPLKRLRATQTPRSPGGTPLLKHRRCSVESTLRTPNALNSSEPLTAAFLRIMEAKFRNVRSPSPAPRHTPHAGGGGGDGSFVNSPQQFTP